MQEFSPRLMPVDTFPPPRFDIAAFIFHYFVSYMLISLRVREFSSYCRHYAMLWRYATHGRR